MAQDVLIDLHGLPVEVSKIAVQVAIEDLVLGPPGVPAADQLGALIIVTGVGNNSPGNVPLIRPAVTSFLREELSLKVLDNRDGPGRLRIPASELRTGAVGPGRSVHPLTQRTHAEATKEVSKIKKEIKEITSTIPDGRGRFVSNDVNLRLEFCVRDLGPYNREGMAFEESILDGKWRVIFCSCDALLGGSFGLLDGEATQSFDFKGRKKIQRELRLKTEFFLGLFAMEWRTVWTPTKGDVAIGEEEWYPFIFGQKIPLFSFSIKGLMKWQNLYTDETMRVLRVSKKASKVEGLVILEKVKK
eukprot:g27703.t1